MRIFFLLLISFITSINIFSQPELKFVRYSTADGLAQNYVMSICQDNFGFIWIGTRDGASRFDGINFKTWQFSENQPGSVGEGWINQIVCDSKNRLWLAIAGAGCTFMMFDYEREQFIDIGKSIKEQIHLNNKPFDFWSVFIDSEGLLWLGVSNNIICYNTDNRNVTTYQNQPDYIRDFIEDDYNNIWIATNQGLLVLNKSNMKFKTYKHNPNNPQSISSDNCNGLFQDSRGMIWVGTYKGVNCFKPSSSKPPVFKRFVNNPDNQHSLSHNVVNDIGEDINNDILIATIDGLNLIDRKNNKVYRYYNDETDTESINSNLIRCIYRDHQGNMWIGTSSGVGKIQFKNFKSYSYSANRNSISHNKVQSICESLNNEIWIATPKGIDIFNVQKQQFRFIAGITSDKKGLYGSPLDFCPENNKGMWIGTWAGGFSYIDYFTNEIVNYITFESTKNITNAFSVLVDSKNNLWVGTQGTGLYQFNAQRELNHVFLNDKDNKRSIGSDWINGIMEDSENNIWVGTIHGLDLLIDVDNGFFNHFLNNLEINSVIEGRDKNVWIGTNKGLYCYHRRIGEFKKNDIETGLPGNNIFCILEDNSNDLWITTNKGLSRVTPIQDSLINITTFRKEDGLTVESYLPWSGTKLKNGFLLFGGTEGFCMFHPENIKIDSTPPKIVFTNLKVANKTAKINKEINGQVILNKSITKTKHLIFNHKNNEFAIEFVCLQYNMSQYNKYCYRLEGYDQNNSWNYISNNEYEIKYMNLPVGDYTLKIKTANSFNVWATQPAKLAITILPPLWKTAWFSILWILLLVLSVILFVRIRLNSLKKQKEHLENVVKERTRELKEINVILKEQKEELEIQAKQMEKKSAQVERMAVQLHKADQSKLRFFANISHEFRTPLSLIIAPLEKYSNIKKITNIDEWLNIRRNQQLMLRNAKRLLRLVNQLIDFRKIDQQRKKLYMSNNDIVEFINEIKEAITPLTEQKNIQLSVIKKQTSENKGQSEVQSSNLFEKKPSSEIHHPSSKISDQPNFPLPLTTGSDRLFKGAGALNQPTNNTTNQQFNNFWFDADIMEKILYNLISNAIKYTPEGGKVSISIGIVVEMSYSTSLHEKQLVIIISDTGIGIKKENFDKIFDRFYRIKSDERHTKEGTGIGLAFTKELVKLHGGDITVESKPGVGTEFTLKFPFLQKPSKNAVEKFNFSKTADNLDKQTKEYEFDYIKSMINEENVQEDSDDGSSTSVTEEITPDINLTQKKTETILIIEDNAELRGFIKNELINQYMIFEAENGEEGWETAVRTDPNLILSDVMMPHMDGVELCKKIKEDENTCHIPLIFLTAKSGEENMLIGLKTGADDYITKPFNMDILKTKIHNLLLTRKKLQDKFNRSEFIAPSELATSNFDDRFMKKAFDVVNENLQDCEFDNEAFVKLMDSSRSLVYKKIKNLTNQSVGAFIRTIRLKTAAQYFNSGHDSISEVCYLTGFKYPNIFARHFSKLFGKTPSQFIKERIQKY